MSAGRHCAHLDSCHYLKPLIPANVDCVYANTSYICTYMYYCMVEQKKSPNNIFSLLTFKYPFPFPTLLPIPPSLPPSLPSSLPASQPLADLAQHGNKFSHSIFILGGDHIKQKIFPSLEMNDEGLVVRGTDAHSFNI